MAENWITDIAITCGISQNQVREINMFREGDLTHFGQPMINCNLQRVWREVLDKSSFEERERSVCAYNRKNRWKKRGIAVTPTKYGISFECLFLNQAGALVHVYTDGSVLLTHGGTEMGQGLHTKMAQVASRALEIPLSKIHISETSTNTVPNTSPTSASVSTDLNGMAVKAACEKIKKRLSPFKSDNPEGQWKDWVQAAYRDRVSLSATGFYKTPGLTEFDWSNSRGIPFSYFSYGAACSEVEIDCLTGDHQILRTDLVMDVGRSINPAIDIGQIEGAFVQGIGLFTLEEIQFSREGVLQTFGPATYKIPGFQDIPMEFNVHILPNSANDKAVYSSKGVGEPPLFLASSVLYAIKDAVAAARSDVGLQGRFRMDSPATSQRIRLSCVDQFTKQASTRNQSSGKSSL